MIFQTYLKLLSTRVSVHRATVWTGMILYYYHKFAIMIFSNRDKIILESRLGFDRRVHKVCPYDATLANGQGRRT